MSQIAQLEAQKKDLREAVDLRDQILRLSQNIDFRAVIEEDYLIQEAARNARTAGDPNLTAEMRADCISMAIASGHLQRFLSARVKMGNTAEDTIIQIDEALEELRAEGGDED